MFERYTQRARDVVSLAGEEARTLKHGRIGTEHILLGLLREHGETAARILESFDLTLERARGEVVRIVGVGQEPVTAQTPLTPRSKQVLERALRESLALGHHYIDPEHILLAMTTLEDGTALRILRDCHTEPDRIRAAVLHIVARPPEPAQAAPDEEPPSSGNGFEEWIRVGPGAGVRRLLMIAAARALDEGREDIQPRDVLLALTRDGHTGPLLAELGVDDAAILRALERRPGPQGPAES